MPASERYGATQTAPAPPARGPAPAPPAVARRAPQHGDGAQRGLDGCSRDPGGALPGETAASLSSMAGSASRRGGRRPATSPGPAHACRRGDRRPAHVGCAELHRGAPCVLPDCYAPSSQDSDIRASCSSTDLDLQALAACLRLRLPELYHLCLRANGEERACVCGREEREHAPARARARARARAGKIERVCVCV